MDKIEYHQTLCMQLSYTYEHKNADYGDSFAAVRKKYPQAVCIRLADKLSRLETLLGNEDQAMVAESIEDTLLDLANYAIMEVVERAVDDGKCR